MKKSLKSLKNLKQIDGKLDKPFIPEVSQPVERPNTIEQILQKNYAGLWKYKTMNEAEYTLQLSQMSKSDLYTHATNIGILPNENRERLVRNLLKQFQAHVTSHKIPNVVETSQLNMTPDIAKILQGGR